MFLLGENRGALYFNRILWQNTKKGNFHGIELYAIFVIIKGAYSCIFSLVWNMKYFYEWEWCFFLHWLTYQRLKINMKINKTKGRFLVFHVFLPLEHFIPLHWGLVCTIMYTYTFVCIYWVFKKNCMLNKSTATNPSPTHLYSLYSHSCWLAFFWTSNISSVLAGKGGKILIILRKKNTIFLSTLLVSI